MGEQERLTKALAASVGFRDDADWSIQRAYLELAHTFEAEFMEDMRLMGVLKPDMLTRVSEYTDKIVTYIQRIIDRGYAYASNGSVYFDVPSFESAPNHKYAKLNKAALENVELAMDGEGALAADASEKRAENDFVLWKKSKPGEPAGRRPWGEGRPGWHIECSAMCSDVLGETVDINGGGIDLNFPHHENQLAQSEAFYDCEQWVNTFVHTGHLHIDGLKMSKSLKNFITIGAALKMYSARQIRFLFLLHQWSDPMDLTPVSERDAATGEERRRVCADGAGGGHREGVCGVFPPGEGRDARDAGGVLGGPGTHLGRSRAGVVVRDRRRARGRARRDAGQHQHPGTVRALKELVGATNVYLAKTNQNDVRPLLVDSAARFVTSTLACLGVAEHSGGIGFGEIGADADKKKGTGAGASAEEAMAPALDALVKFRDEIRALAKGAAVDKGALMRACDALRDEGLPAIGVKLDDRDGGALWKMSSPEELQKELARETEAKAKKELGNAPEKGGGGEKGGGEGSRARVDPREMFTLGEYAGVYAEYDEEGIPTKTKDGEEVAKAQRKKLAKAHGAQKTAHEKYLAKRAAEGVAQVKL